MNSWTARYLKIRTCVLYMANPYFYLCTYGLAVILALIGGRDGITTQIVFGIWDVMKDISSFLFFAGTGEATRDAHLTLTFVLPSLLVLIWIGVEKITGINARLKQNGLIPE